GGRGMGRGGEGGPGGGGGGEARRPRGWVDGHVVERSAAGTAEVPARVDRAATAVPLALRLQLVVPLERGAADRPGRRPDRSRRDQAPDLLVVRPQHLTR